MEIGGQSKSQFDSLHATGSLTLGGTLDVSLVDGFVPSRLNKFDILSWNTLSGKFSSLQLPALPGSLGWNTSNLYTMGELSVIDLTLLPGDMNRDHQITSADLPLLQQALTDKTAYELQTGVTDAELAILGDTNESGTFDNGDLQGLLNELIYGTSFSAGSPPALNEKQPLSVPEPSTLILLGLGALWAPWQWRRIRSRRTVN
jgi:hypothetical protein